MTATNKISIKLEMHEICDLEVDQDIHLALYRILQEHLTNVMKHADAESVDIFLRLIDNVLTMKVTDNGRGFDLKKKRNGIGITNMTTRAESVKGKLQINSAIDIGCVLIVQIPLNTPAQHSLQSVLSFKS